MSRSAVTIPVRMCESVRELKVQVPSSDADGMYTVEYHHMFTPLWVCSCPHHRFRKAVCKHIRAAMATRCNYGWEGMAGSPANITGTRCPECDGPLITVSVAI